MEHSITPILKLVGMSRGSLWDGAVLGCPRSNRWPLASWARRYGVSRVLGGGGFGHDWEETSSRIDESRS